MDSFLKKTKLLTKKKYKEPEKLKIEYKNDYNILNLHRRIIDNFESMKNKIILLQDEIDKLEPKLKNEMRMLDRYEIEEKIIAMKDEINDINTNKSKNEYLKKTKPLLLKYKNLKPSITEDNFWKVETYDKEEDKTKLNSRINLIEDYFDIAQDYYPISVYRNMKSNFLCDVCGNSTNNYLIEDGVLVCECGLQKPLITTKSIFKDSKRVESNKINNYQDRKNFTKTIKEFQGGVVKEVPEGMFDDLDHYLSSKGVPISTEIRSMPLINGERGQWIGDYGQKLKTSRDLLAEALKKTGYSDQYKNIRYICWKYWGWENPDISHLINKLLDDYDRIQPYIMMAKQKITGEKGGSSINVQFRLLVHLRVYDKKYTSADFKTPITPDIMNRCILIWNSACKLSGFDGEYNE